MNWARVIEQLDAIALAEAKSAQTLLIEAGGGPNRGQELLAIVNRKKIGANILLQLSQALQAGLKK